MAYIISVFVQTAEQLVTSRKYLIGMLERDLTDLGEDKTTSSALEKIMAELMLKLSDLRRQRRLGYVQHVCSAGQVPLPGDDPKVSQMVVVEHINCSLLKNVIFIIIYFYE